MSSKKQKNQNVKKRLCWNCEGSVPVIEEHCPICGVYLSPVSLDGNQQDSLTPPYKLTEDEPEIPTAPYAEAAPQEKAINHEMINDKTETNVVALAAFLILAGALFLIFSLALLFFSHNGVLTLRWNASYWYGYLLLSLPMLYFGWNYLQKVKD